jgi:tRNA threonylcarbamoyl adenosine modification protein YeaZ
MRRRDVGKFATSFKLFLFFPVRFPYFGVVSEEVALVLETSVETGSIALVSSREVLFERSFHAGRKPSATLWEPLQEALATEITPTHVVVGLGPGSYNGVRIAIAAAQGIALIKECPTAGLCSFEGVALRGKGLAIGDARRGSFSLQRMNNGRCEGEVALVDEATLAHRIENAFAEGMEVFCFEEVARFPLQEELMKQVQRRQSQAGLLGTAFWGRSPEERVGLETPMLEPIYLRAPHITVGKRRSLLSGKGDGRNE